MKRVYVAGAYSADNVLDVLDNMRKGIQLSKKVFLSKFAPFSPWLDFHYTLQLLDGEEISLQDYYDYSIAWLEVSDAMLLVPGWEESKGTKTEINVADELDIPIFHSLRDLIKYGS